MEYYIARPIVLYNCIITVYFYVLWYLGRRCWIPQLYSEWSSSVHFSQRFLSQIWVLLEPPIIYYHAQVSVTHLNISVNITPETRCFKIPKSCSYTFVLDLVVEGATGVASVKLSEDFLMSNRAKAGWLQDRPTAGQGCAQHNRDNSSGITFQKRQWPLCNCSGGKKWE